ncbi:hypothetical protein COCCADRAFT_96199 [Bipolaris zeicola 26-R-13]|uniref:F-box domain-containing protein n=1 Tax=Cochliobolus carbonum (strain 26-R-13) TaxID=930089 RepID=W6Y0Y3_COCC2|nr:uncharacterized protein COCCADRAFT_96199 [Bipolaris zeicola 26-R-13]EUC33392.1 hypothetical protein COCCADRAFT_96199 [Bipolaris zeicola 26-R-13]
MAKLTDLPNEVLESIYHALGSIDDVHHLIRTCKITARVTCQRKVYLGIMRSIIHHSPQHRHDYQLNKMLAVHAPNWSDMAICDVLARYQGLRILEDIWLSRQLEEEDYLSVSDAEDHQEFSEGFFTLVTRADELNEGQLQRRHPKDKHTCSYTSMNPDQRARFYAAVVRIWLANEVRWALTNFDSAKNLLEPCKIAITYLEDEPLIDRLDECAVFTFMYHHLLPRNIKFLADRDSSKLPFTFESDFRRNNAHCCKLLQICLTAGQAYFQPPDLIDLAVRWRLGRRPPYPAITMPESSEEWRHPQSTDSPPLTDLCDKDTALRLLRVCLRHVARIVQSSIQDDAHPMARLRNVTQLLQLSPRHGLLNISDWAMAYLVDRVMCEFERDKSPEEDLRDMKSIFQVEWKDVQWEIWWWANNDDKARMKMTRWFQRIGLPR